MSGQYAGENMYVDLHNVLFTYLFLNIYLHLKKLLFHK